MDFDLYMHEAIAQARDARAIDEVPIGCVVVDAAGAVIGRGHNRRESAGDPTAHAEILALRQAAAARGNWRLDGCTLVVTLEPCPMCAGAAVNARIQRVVFGCTDPKAGAVRTLYQLCDDPRLNHRCEVTGGVMAAECAGLLGVFFKAQRAMGKK
jgi:tRNA(adenine34) deaminase